MVMKRTLPLVVAVLLLFVGGWFVWDSFQGPKAQATDTEKAGAPPAERSPNPTAKRAKADVPVGEPVPAAEAASREKLTIAESQRTEDIPADQAVRVRVVQELTNQPTPGATVHYLPMDWASKLSKEEREKLGKQLTSISALLSRSGYLAAVDDRGLATVRKSAKGTFVHGRFGEMVGQLFMERDTPEPADGWTLELRKEWSLRVQVVDRDDRPVPEIAIALVGMYEPQHRSGFHRFVRMLGNTREPDGFFEQEQARRFLEGWSRQGVPTDTACALYLPGLLDTKAPFDPAQPPTKPLRLVLPDTGSIRAEIVDRGGKPIAGQSWVGVKLSGGKHELRGTAKTGGVIRFPWVALGKSYDLTAHAGKLSKQETVRGPTTPGEEITVKITLPATGKVVVRLMGPTGQPFTSSWSYVNLQRKGQQQTFKQEKFDERGIATFKQVPLGETWDVIVRSASLQKQKQVAGPGRPGETVQVQFQVSDEVPILVGRVLDADGKPLAKRRLWIRYGGGGSSAMTDSKGGFQRVMGTHFVDRPVKQLELLLQDRNGRNTGESARPPHPASFPAGITDLGDVVLKKASLVLSGVLKGYRPDRRGPPPSLTVERHRISTRRGVQREYWRSDQSVHLMLSDAGSFEFRGTPEPGRLRVKVSATGYLPLEPIEFAIGTKGLEVPLIQGGSVTATVKVDRGTAPATLQARLVPTSGQPDHERGWDDPLRGESDYRGGRGTGELGYRWKGLRPGVYRLEIGPKGMKEPPIMVANVQVTAGRETRDPRLKGLDLRGKLRQVTLTIQTPDGKPLKWLGQSTVLIRPPGKLTDLEGQSIDRQGQVKLVLGTEPLRVLVIVQGYAVKDVDGILTDTTIRLDPPLQIEVRLRGGGPAVPEGSTLQLMLSSTRRPDPAFARLRYRTPQGGGGLSGMLNVRVPSVTVKDGVAVFQVPQPGEYRVYGMIAGARGARRRVLQATPGTIQVENTGTEQSFEVELSQQ